MPGIHVKSSRNLLILSLTGLVYVVVPHTSTSAGQFTKQIEVYSTIDPFDPSEIVSHNLKDDIRLRLRLPAPDLPPSIIASAPIETAKVPTSIDTEASPIIAHQQPIKKDQLGLISKSIKSVMSIFDWSDHSNDTTKKANPVNSDGPIRINIHVGIKKPKNQTTQPAEDVSSLDTPLSRNQERIRRLFTFDEIKTYN